MAIQKQRASPKPARGNSSQRHGAQKKISDALKQAAERGESLTTRQAAEMTGYDRDHIALMLRRNLVKGSRPGRDWFVEARSLSIYILGQPRPGRKRKV